MSLLANYQLPSDLMRKLTLSVFDMRIKSLFLLALFLSVNLSHASTSMALDWLQRMHHAVHTLDYEGQFLYQVDSHVETMYVVHRVDNGRELERLVAMDGEEREMVRKGQAVAFLEPGGLPMSISGGEVEALKAKKAGVNYKKITQNYAIEAKGAYRVAGRDTHVVSLLPKDKLRFGHRLYLDKETFLPLRSMMFDETGAQRMQVSFVDVKIGDGITPIEQDISALSQAKSRPLLASVTDRKLWDFTHLPAGFVLDFRHYYPNEQREHLVFSDGLTSVSMYIENLQDNALSGHSRRGTSQIYGANKYGKQITLMGEVPSATLEMFIHAMRPAS
jgi:sigma-E factor negative regulatory protein RseB